MSNILLMIWTSAYKRTNDFSSHDCPVSPSMPPNPSITATNENININDCHPPPSDIELGALLPSPISIPEHDIIKYVYDKLYEMHTFFWLNIVENI